MCCGRPFPCIEPSDSGSGQCGQKQHKTCWSEQLVCDSHDFNGHLDDSEKFTAIHLKSKTTFRGIIRHKLFGAGGILILKNLQSKKSLWNVYKSFQKCPVVSTVYVKGAQGCSGLKQCNACVLKSVHIFTQVNVLAPL